MRDFGMQALANTAWAYASLAFSADPLMDAIAAASIRTLGARRAQTACALPVDFVLSLAEALQGAGRLGGPLLAAAAGALQRHGARRDAEAGPWAPPAPPKARGGAAPGVLVAQPRLWVLWKPPGWALTVADDDGAPGAGGTAAGGRGRERAAGPGRPLEGWLERALGGGCPIAGDRGASRGFVHRLDRDTSGALLWASCYSGFYAARLQLRAQGVRKEYTCLCWGRLRLGPACLDSPLLRVERALGFPRSVVSPQGRRARTEVLGVRHLLCPQGHEVSLVHVRIHTGRLHQIRSHLSHEGHPLVGDEIYGSEHAPWCPQIFLHACKLATDIGDGLVDVDVPLTPALGSALGALALAEARSLPRGGPRRGGPGPSAPPAPA